MDYYYTREIVRNMYNLEDSQNRGELSEEIPLALPEKTLNSIVCDGSEVIINITPDLDESEKNILDQVIKDHKADILSPYKINDSYDDPRDFNIALFGLFREDIFDSLGALVTKNYYRNYDNGIYSDLVVKDEYFYTYKPPYGLVDYRDETITWYLENNKIGCTKTFRKYYTSKNSIIEANTRRENLIDQAQAYGMANIQGYDPILEISEGQKFFLSIKDEIENYRVGVKMQDLIDKIQAYVSTAVTQEMKDDLCDIFNYWD